MTSLNVYNNGIGVEGARYLADAVKVGVCRGAVIAVCVYMWRPVCVGLVCM